MQKQENELKLVENTGRIAAALEELVRLVKFTMKDELEGFDAKAPEATNGR